MAEAHAAPRPFDAVICDVDGCLQPERHDPIDLDALGRVRAYNELARGRGDRPVVTLCTGRPLPYVEAVCRAIANTTLPVVGEMGVWLWHPDTNRYECDPAITPADMHAVHEAQEWLEREYGSGEGKPGVVQQPGKACSISLYHDDTAYLKSIEPAIREAFEARGWPFRISSTWLWINCDLAHVSKATGIERLMRHTGLAKPRLAGIGDTLGDLAIREHVAFFACPSNAAEELKPHADYVSDKPEIEGVLDILERLTARE